MDTQVKLKIQIPLAELGMSRQELSDRTGISLNSIGNLMRHPTAIRLATLARLVEATGLPVEKLIVAE